MIHLTKVVQPEVGGILLHHCSGCQRTEIYVSEFADKPTDGDAWEIEAPCVPCSQYSGKVGAVTVRKAEP